MRTSAGASVLVWAALASLVITPLYIAASNPLQSARGTLYVVGGLAGVLAIALLLVQPLLATGLLPGIHSRLGKRLHRWLGFALVVCVVAHVGGLYLTSPDDILDALLLIAPTPFSVYGVIGMCSVLLTVCLVFGRRRLGMKDTAWRLIHQLLALVTVVSSVVHAIRIEGAMGSLSKQLLCTSLVLVTIGTLLYRGLLKPYFRKR